MVDSRLSLIAIVSTHPSSPNGRPRWADNWTKPNGSGLFDLIWLVDSSFLSSSRSHGGFQIEPYCDRLHPPFFSERTSALG
ncbi:hypothetical protein CA85_03840 [Allorhodopirellula solitaria]|uniref:Uncharacterized protein n=1 Tax=Allorhodopirellula solitaria TaxID=2527987 RepID=A0A5C5YJM5_9BACT|nr:hypothetical protein CA85_03840 [Allorhodopirellula solitaria]